MLFLLSGAVGAVLFHRESAPAITLFIRERTVSHRESAPAITLFIRERTVSGAVVGAVLIRRELAPAITLFIRELTVLGIPTFARAKECILSSKSPDSLTKM